MSDQPDKQSLVVFFCLMLLFVLGGFSFRGESIGQLLWFFSIFHLLYATPTLIGQQPRDLVSAIFTVLPFLTLSHFVSTFTIVQTLLSLSVLLLAVVCNAVVYSRVESTRVRRGISTLIALAAMISISVGILTD